MTIFLIGFGFGFAIIALAYAVIHHNAKTVQTDVQAAKDAAAALESVAAEVKKVV